MIVSYERNSGERLWTYDVRQDGSAQSFHGDLLREGDTLYIAADPAEGHVYSFEAVTGKLQWKWDSTSGVSSDLVTSCGLLIVVTLDNELVALDTVSGRQVWRTDGAPGVRGMAPTSPSPIITAEDVVWGRKDGLLSRRNARTGQLTWEKDLGDEISMDLLVVGESIVVGLEDGRLLRIDPANGDILAAAVLENAPTYRWFVVGDQLIVGMTGVSGPQRQLLARDAKSLEPVWKVDAPRDSEWTTAQPAIGWGHVLIGANDLLLYGIDSSNGSINWIAEMNQPPRTVRVVGDDLYVGSFDGSLTAYRRSSLE